MMKHNGGWVGGWGAGEMWLWTAIGVLAVVLPVVAVIRLSRK